MTRICTSGVLLALVVLLALAGTAQAQAPPGGPGQCTDYCWVKLNTPPWRVPATYGNAKDWVNWLPGVGLKRAWPPQVGDTVVFQPNPLRGIGPLGHVGRVVGIQCVVGGFRIQLRGANQFRPITFVDYYTNVSDLFFTVSPNGDATVSFWRR